MPGESGLALVEHVAAEHPETATIMVTGADDSAIAEKALALGTYGYVIKPFYNNELLINIANALRRRRLELESGKAHDLARDRGPRAHRRAPGDRAGPAANRA